MSGQDTLYSQLVPHLFRIHIRIHVFACNRGRTHVERAGIREYVGDLVSQGKAQIIIAGIAGHVLQWQHCDRIALHSGVARAVLDPPHSHRNEHGKQQGADT